MNKEEQEYIEHEIVDRLYCLQEQDFDKTKVTNDYIQAVIKAGKENKKLIDKLQKELEKANKQLDLDYVDNNFISKDEIKQLIGYEENEDVSKGEIISLLKTMWEEFNRLEDIEDKMFTKYISKNEIRNKIKELEEELIQNYGTLGESLTTTEIKTLKKLLGE